LSAVEEENLAGRTLAQRYDLLELVGTGGMGAVYRARDRELDELVALKVIRTQLASDPAVVERFRSEVKLARRVTHANVARTFELGNADGVMFCTMELVEGESLAKRLRQRHRIPLGEAVAIAAAVLDGVAAAHAADVIHRDIKPDNVLIANDGRVVMADFGVAAASVAEHRELSGTPAYMSPEQARGEPPTPAADVYAVGLVLAEMLTGHRAFGGDATKILADKQTVEHVALSPDLELPVELVAVIAKASARDLDQRYASATDMRSALEPWLKGTRMVTHPARLFVDSPEVVTVVVIGSRGDGPLQHLVDGVHEELVARLGRTPRTRVLPRAVSIDEPGAFEIRLAATDELVVTLARDGAQTAQLHFPLAVERIELVAEALSRAVVGTIATVMATPTKTAEHEAIELVLRARSLAVLDPRRIGDAMVMLQQAVAIAPDSPRASSQLAVAELRLSFFDGRTAPAVREQAAARARRAMAIAPHLVEPHLAMGQVELNLGDAIVAAGHFRRAIACAPYSPEAHEQLGRMLLEAGYLEQAIARLEEAIAINPNARGARWEIARAYALEGRWPEHDAIVEEMMAAGYDRSIARARYAWWRRDIAKLHTLGEQMLDAQRTFVPGLMNDFFKIFLDGNWIGRRDVLRENLKALPPNRRRRSFIGQLTAEAAAFSGDIPFVFEMIEYALSEGLFDLHWLDFCPLLVDARADPAWKPLRLRVKARADAILDALYGDLHLGTSETAVASGF
jgi:serine/threonine-protein kinase